MLTVPAVLRSAPSPAGSSIHPSRLNSEVGGGGWSHVPSSASMPRRHGRASAERVLQLAPCSNDRIHVLYLSLVVVPSSAIFRGKPRLRSCRRRSRGTCIRITVQLEAGRWSEMDVKLINAARTSWGGPVTKDVFCYRWGIRGKARETGSQGSIVWRNGI